MNRRIFLTAVLAIAVAIVSACGNGIDSLPGTSNTGAAISVQLVQPPPATLAVNAPVGVAATVLNDKNNEGVTWSCAPAGSCGSFNPATTGYQITALYTPPALTPSSPLILPVTITATSVADNSQSVSATTFIGYASPALLSGQYAFVQEGYGSFGVVGSVTLDGNGNVLSGELDYSCAGSASSPCGSSGAGQSGNFPICPSAGTYNGGHCATPASGYTIDYTGHGKLTVEIVYDPSTGASYSQTSSITLTSTSHALIAEDDQFNGLTFGGVGSLDLQTPNAVLAAGGYSFTLTGSTAVNGSSWGGIFTADGAGNVSNGIFDENSGGGSGYSSVAFTGSYSAPDANGRGILTVSATPDTPSSSTQYVYYIVTPEVIRLTTATNVGNAAGTGSAFGQGSVATGATNTALSGSYIFSEMGFSSNANGGEQSAAAGQFTTDPASGTITAGVMDLNAFGVPSTIPVTGSYLISGSPRGTITGPSAQTYNVYLTDPNLNLLDPNNSTGTGGALLLETDSVDTIGTVIPQTDATSTLAGGYAIFLSDQDNPPNSDGGFTGDLDVISAGTGTAAGEGDFEGTGSGNATPTVGPLSGTFTADSNNPGRFTGTLVTAPAFPLATTLPGTENVSYYLANGSQGFVVETDSLAPIFGAVETQGATAAASPATRRNATTHRSRSTDSGEKDVDDPRRSK
jgi:hypothetical protein